MAVSENGLFFTTQWQLNTENESITIQFVGTSFFRPWSQGIKM